MEGKKGKSPAPPLSKTSAASVSSPSLQLITPSQDLSTLEGIKKFLLAEVAAREALTLRVSSLETQLADERRARLILE